MVALTIMKFQNCSSSIFTKISQRLGGSKSRDTSPEKAKSSEDTGDHLEESKDG